MKRKIALALVMGIMMVGTTLNVSAAKESANRVDPVNPTANYETLPVDKQKLDQSMEEFVKELDMLTETEKKQLIEESIALEPYYKEISRLSIAIEDETVRILEGAEEYFDERREIMSSANSKLWDKLWDNMNSSQKKMDDYIEIIKASTALTKSEKNILIEEQIRLNELDAEIDKYYQKAEEETKELSKELEKNRTALQKIKAKSVHIWEKVYGPESVE